jgi:hypothetical protein
MQMLTPVSAGEREAYLREVSGHDRVWGTPPPNHGSPLSWADGINPLYNEPAIADRSVSGNRDRPPWLARLS